jgi:hypothetical protein
LCLGLFRRPRSLHLFFTHFITGCASEQMGRHTGHSEKRRCKMALAGEPHSSCNGGHRPARCSKKFLSSLDTDAGHIGMRRLACCRFEHSGKMVRAHMDARGYTFEREPRGQSGLDIVLNKPKFPNTQLCLAIRKASGNAQYLRSSCETSI